MSNNATIEIFLRVRPVKDPSNNFKLNLEQNTVQFAIPKDLDVDYINNNKEKKAFLFNRVFDQSTRQQQIFDKVAKEVLDAGIQGYNGTIFAYGQTGSGKTFTMTGGADSVDDKGIIPRSMRYLFEEKRKRGGHLNIHIAYLQIYNGSGYDLLDPNNNPDDPNPNRQLSQLKKIRPQEGANGEIRFDNLTIVPVDTEEKAIEILYVGDMNRVMCQTPMNDQSTRSHCIFMITIESQVPGSDIRKRAFVYLVDLSGSERIKNTGVEGRMEQEARNINLTLHYLEHVIVCLSEKAKGKSVHVPYRESLLTLILKDAIGGNCKTRMVATINPKEASIPESIATCNFAKRVAMIKNSMTVNEEVDPAVIVARLKRENAQLKAELALLKGGDVQRELDKWDIEQCRKKVDEFVASEDPSAAIILSEQLKINECFFYFKTLIKQHMSGSKQSQLQVMVGEKSVKENTSLKIAKGGGGANEADLLRAEEEIKRLKLMIQHKDNEIALFLDHIKKLEGKGDTLTIPVHREANPQDIALLKSAIQQKPIEFKETAQLEKSSLIQQQSMISKNSKSTNANNTTIATGNQVSKQQLAAVQSMLSKPLDLTNEQLLNQTVVFEQFRKAYRKQEVIQRNEQLLKEKMQEGKELGKIVNQTREKTNKLKNSLERIRNDAAVAALVSNTQPQVTEEEKEILELIQEQKRIYKPNYERLKELKNQIMDIQNIVKKNAALLQRDFEKYLEVTQRARKVQQQQPMNNNFMVPADNMSSVSDRSKLLMSNVKDQEVKKHMESFYQVIDSINNKK